jgi:hypothetical protein
MRVYSKKEIIILDRTLIKKGILSTSFLINVGLLVVTIILLSVVMNYPDMARAFPRLVLVMVLVITILDCIFLLRGKKEETASERANQGIRRRRWKVFYMVILMFVFYFFLVAFSLVPATLLFLLLSGWTLGYRKPIRLIVSSLIITTFVWVIFDVIMNSLLPEAAILKIFGG